MDEFIQKQNEIYKKLKQYQRNMNMIALLRLIVFILMIIFLLIGYFYQQNYLYIFSLISLIIFFILIYFHQQYQDQYHYYDNLYKVYQKHIMRIQGKWHDFSETGAQFINDKDYKITDLDILGKSSLFQMINVASTYQGQSYLSYLLTQDSQKEEILQRQEAVEELASMKEFVIEMETLNISLNNQTLDTWLHQIKKIHVKKVSSIIFMLSIVTVIGLIGVCFSIGYPYSRIILEIGFMFQLALSLLTYGVHSQLFEPVIKLSEGIQNYLKSFEKIKDTNFKSNYLINIQDCIDIEALKKLSSIAEKINYRQNIIAFVLLNGLGLFDFYITNQYNQWLELYQYKVNDYFVAFGKLEALMSLSILKIDGFHVCTPNIIDDKTLSFHQLKHPLINEEKAIGNDFDMQESSCIITGSNMSGKTTFMRTIALNLVLAYSGGYVFGDDFMCYPMHIMTSMRVKDNVEEGISTFYGELLRIKEMIDYSKKQLPLICFIDEIFKGTNSLDRIAGASETIQKLSQEHIYLFVTTHDYELTHLPCLNYHFTEYYENNKIYFDYTIKKGPATSSNGQFLLKQVGIIE
ncbi:MAG: hypothetical protein LUG60_10955 [Erysipelotrichaceae bacterium]|nr:hypothetical protein [Erysipelotrichaceae bacterium]